MATNTQRITALEAWRTLHKSEHAKGVIHSHSEPAPEPPPVEPPPPTSPGVYGPAIAMDSKNNMMIGRQENHQVAHRWQSVGGQMVDYSFNQRFGADGAGYSMGTGGVVELGLYRCGADGLPAGSPISTITFRPSNPKTQAETKTAIPWSAAVPAGLVCITHRNVDPDFANNWMSANEVYLPDGGIQPAFRDGAMAVLNRYFTNPWAVNKNNTPVFDVHFSDGRHEGQAYYERFVPPNEFVMSGAGKVRERFTPKTSLNVTAVGFRVQRQSGSKLYVSLAGKTAEAAISQIPVEVAWNGVTKGGVWVEVPLAVTLPAGVEASCEFSTDGSLRVTPIREYPGWGSRRFPEGVAEKYSGSWAPMYYDGNADLQLYLDVA